MGRPRRDGGFEPHVRVGESYHGPAATLYPARSALTAAVPDPRVCGARSSARAVTVEIPTPIFTRATTRLLDMTSYPAGGAAMAPGPSRGIEPALWARPRGSRGGSAIMRKATHFWRWRAVAVAGCGFEVVRGGHAPIAQEEGERWGSASEGRAYTFRSNGTSLAAWANVGP